MKKQTPNTIRPRKEEKVREGGLVIIEPKKPKQEGKKDADTA